MFVTSDSWPRSCRRNTVYYLMSRNLKLQTCNCGWASVSRCFNILICANLDSICDRGGEVVGVHARLSPTVSTAWFTNKSTGDACDVPDITGLKENPFSIDLRPRFNLLSLFYLTWQSHWPWELPLASDGAKEGTPSSRSFSSAFPPSPGSGIHLHFSMLASLMDRYKEDAGEHTCVHSHILTQLTYFLPE